MFKFKKKSTTNESNTNNVTKHNLYIPIFIGLILLLLTSLVLFFYFKSKKSPRSLPKREFSLIPEPKPYQKETSTTNITEESTCKDKLTINENISSINNDIAMFYDLYSFLLSKLHNKDSKKFNIATEDFSKGYSHIIYDQYQTILKYFDKIETYELNTKEIKESYVKIESTNYNKVLFEFGSALYYIYIKLKDKNGLSITNENETSTYNSTDTLFIYQQLHLQLILKNMVKVVEVYQLYIFNKLEKYLKSEVFIELTNKLYLQLNTIKEQLFKPFNKTIGMIYNGNYVFIETLMDSFETYEKFLKLNLYVVFMHLFIPSLDYEVTGVNSYFIRYFLNLYSIDSDEIIKSKENKIIYECTAIFYLTTLIGDGKEFFDMEYEPFDGCCICLFEKKCSND